MHGRFNFGVDLPVTNFTGREKELEDLKKAFECGNQRFVLWGMGGVGKTQLARMFAKRHTESYSCVLWLKSESYEDLENSFKNLAFDRLGIKAETANGKTKDIASILNEVKEVLQNRKCLFIFDNIQYMVEGSTGTSKLDVFLRYLPDNYKLLMTSRRREWENFFPYPLEPFSDDDATFLIRESLKDHVKFDTDQVKDLAELTKNLPLAIQQAIAYIKKKSKDAKQRNGTFGIDSYLTKFQANSKTFLEYNLQKYNDDDYFKTTLNVSMEAIRKENNGKLCEDLFHRISYFYPDGIPKSDIVQCFHGKTEINITASFEILHDYSMLNYLNDECSVHRLVQNATRVKLKERGEEEAILDALLRECEKLDVRNVVSIWEHSADHKHLIKKYSMLPKDVIWNLINKGKYADGCMYGKRLVQVMESNLDPMDQSMNEVNYALASVMYHHGFHNESYEVSKKVWERSCKILGKERRFTLAARRLMAKVLYDLGRKNECQDISKEVFEMCEKILGREDAESIIARVNYTRCLRESGKLIKSFNMIKEGYEICMKVLGPKLPGFSDAESMKVAMLTESKHDRTKRELQPHFMGTKHELALVLMELKKYNESLDILTKMWELERSYKSEEHPDTLNTRHYMGRAQFELDNYAESKKIFESMYERCCRTLGEEHPVTLNTRGYMGKVEFELDNYEESKVILESVYECQRRTLGEEHPDTLHIRQTLGRVELGLCNYAESLKILDSVYECQRRTLGEEHPDTLDTRIHMGVVLYKDCNYAESHEILENVYKCGRRTYGKRHPETLNIRKFILEVVEKLGPCVNLT